MSFQPRPYQTEGINRAVTFFHDDRKYNGIEILPTGSGKSVVIANIAKELEGKTVVFQPSKEILEQNVRKYMSYGYRAGVYSASAGIKFLDDVTFATIGSVAKKHHIFKQFQNIIVDECHLVNPEQGMYSDFFNSLSHAKVLGLTATPYRLSTGFEGAMLRFITKTEPRVFSKVYARRLLKVRNNLLVFCALVEEARTVVNSIPDAVLLTGETEPRDRERILSQFTKGKIRCVVNVGVLTTGFDYPELETVLIARSTMSLALYYQIIGRVMRPHANKPSGWVVDLGGNVNMFGKIETMRIEKSPTGAFYITNNGRQLTDVTFSKV
jgi:superfamily II DNA or RNA helicase